MNPATREALSEKDPHDFLVTLAWGFPYRRPEDFPPLPKAGKMAVALSCFSTCFGSGGYRQTIAELYGWYPEIVGFLAEIGAEPFASESKRILDVANAHGLDVRDEDDAIALEEFEDYYRASTVRDLPHIDQVSHCMRQYVEKHLDAF